MALITLTYQTIGALDEGAAGAIIDAALREAVTDLDDRGSEDGKSRKVTIVIDLAPGQRDGLIESHVECKVSLPPRRTKKHVCRTRLTKGKPEAVFQEYAGHDPDQRIIDEVEKEAAE